MVDVVGVGLNATDTLIRLPLFPSRGSKVEYTEETQQPGGQVASAMVACQRWGLRTRYVGKLGDDQAALLHADSFAAAGVETRLIRVAGAPSPRSLILVDDEGERTVLGRRDERVVLQPEELDKGWITDARALLIDGHDTAAAVQAAQWARAAAMAVVADVDEVYPGIEDLLGAVDYLIASRDLPGRMTGEKDLHRSLQVLAKRFGGRLVAATLGAGGVLAWDGERFHRAAAYRVPVVDTTGAGDIFHAGFLFALLQNWPLPEQLDFACAAAALNCTAQGARGGIASVEAIRALMAEGERHPTDTA